jgi:hypothetical protein
MDKNILPLRWTFPVENIKLRLDVLFKFVFAWQKNFAQTKKIIWLKFVEKTLSAKNSCIGMMKPGNKYIMCRL